jgi:hypothetical protein
VLPATLPARDRLVGFALSEAIAEPPNAVCTVINDYWWQTALCQNAVDDLSRQFRVRFAVDASRVVNGDVRQLESDPQRMLRFRRFQRR